MAAGRRGLTRPDAWQPQRALCCCACHARPNLYAPAPHAGLPKHGLHFPTEMRIAVAGWWQRQEQNAPRLPLYHPPVPAPAGSVAVHGGQIIYRRPPALTPIKPANSRMTGQWSRQRRRAHPWHQTRNATQAARVSKPAHRIAMALPSSDGAPSVTSRMPETIIATYSNMRRSGTRKMVLSPRHEASASCRMPPVSPIQARQIRGPSA